MHAREARHHTQVLNTSPQIRSERERRFPTCRAPVTLPLAADSGARRLVLLAAAAFVHECKKEFRWDDGDPHDIATYLSKWWLLKTLTEFKIS